MPTGVRTGVRTGAHSVNNDGDNEAGGAQANKRNLLIKSASPHVQINCRIRDPAATVLSSSDQTLGRALGMVLDDSLRPNFPGLLPHFRGEDVKCKKPTGKPGTLYGPEDHACFDSIPVVPSICGEQPLEVYGKGDEEKRACGLSKMIAHQDEPVIVSFGSNNQFDFEARMIAAFPSVTIHVFDCTVKKVKIPVDLKANIVFHKLCLGPRTETAKNGWSMVTWDDAVDRMGITSLEYLKMDIEFSEWAVLPALLSSPVQPAQIAMELHDYHHGAGSIHTFASEWFLRGGYVTIDRRDNHLHPKCVELLLLKVCA